MAIPCIILVRNFSLTGALVKQLNNESECSVDRLYVALNGQRLIAHCRAKVASSHDVRQLQVSGCQIVILMRNCVIIGSFPSGDDRIDVIGASSQVAPPWT
jgi:hypothetical protein